MAGEASEVGQAKRQPSRGMYVLPSLFTAGNMAAGYYAITQSIQGSAADTSYFDRAALAHYSNKFKTDGPFSRYDKR